MRETIRHEMAHIIVANTSGMGDVAAHGQEFQEAFAMVNQKAEEVETSLLPWIIVAIVIAIVIVVTVVGVAGAADSG